MKAVAVFLLSISMSVFSQDMDYCQKNGRSDRVEDGFDVRFCFGTREYMEAFARALEGEDIPHRIYENGDIGYKSSYRD